MALDRGTLTTLFTSFNRTFQNAFGGVESTYTRIATVVNSTTREEEYGWLKDLQDIREWIGDRVVHELAIDGYRIKNRPWEFTVGVDRYDIQDDRVGTYTPLFAEMGQKAAEHPDKLVYGLLADGFTQTGFDGKPFFSDSHTVLDKNGKAKAVSNTQGGTGDPWFLLDTRRMIKPLIYQHRQDFEFTRMDAPVDEVVFSQRRYRYGIDGRSNVGFGFWQLAFASKEPLTIAAYKDLRRRMRAQTRD